MRRPRSSPRPLRGVPPVPAIRAQPDPPPGALAELLGRQVDLGQEYLRAVTMGAAATSCPGCGRPGVFRVANSYRTQQGRRRLRKCPACGYVASETVPSPLPDDEQNHEGH